MVSHAEFAKLRLSQFAPAEDIAQLENWEFLDRIWVGEAIGFSEWLCPCDDPQRLGSIALDFSELPASICESVLTTLQLPLKAGMRLNNLVAVLGAPIAQLNFVSDRTTCEFRYGEGQPYRVSCTVHENLGLTYVVVTAAHLAVASDA